MDIYIYINMEYNMQMQKTVYFNNTHFLEHNLVIMHGFQQNINDVIKFHDFFVFKNIFD